MVENTIIADLARDTNGNIFGWGLKDEPRRNQFDAQKLLNTIITNQAGTDQFGYQSLNRGDYFREWEEKTDMERFNCDIYTFYAERLDSTRDNYLTSVQDTVFGEFLSDLDSVRTFAAIEQVNFDITIQVFGKFRSTGEDSPNDEASPLVWVTKRDVTPEEIRAQANLSLAHGAKGIFYYAYMSYDRRDHWTTALTDVDFSHDASGPNINFQGKWNAVQSLNNKLDFLDDELLDLTWQRAKTISDSTTSNDNFIDKIKSNTVPNEEYYIEAAEFENSSGEDYFMLVNRRTHPDDVQTLTVTLTTAGTLVEDVLASRQPWDGDEDRVAYHLLDSENKFTVKLNPGEGRLFKISDGLSGTISEARYWSGDPFVSNSVTVDEDITLTVERGTTVHFADDKKLKVDGQLIAEGTSSQKIHFKSVNASPSRGDWNSIDIGNSNDPPFAASSIKYAIIEHAIMGVIGRYSDGLTVEDCTFRKNDFGIYAYVSDMEIIGNSIEGTGKYGIFTNNDASDIFENTIDGFRVSPGYGVYIASGSPRIKHNTITDNRLDGIRAYGVCSPSLTVGYSTALNNMITENSGSAVYASGGANVGMGSSHFNRGSNCFVDNDGDEIVNMNPSGTLQAQYNAWGGFPRSSEFTGSVNYSNYYMSPSFTCGDPMMIFFDNIYENLNDMVPSFSSMAYADQAEDTLGSSLSLLGNDKLFSGDYSGAISIFKDVISSYPNSPSSEYALTMIREAFIKDGKKSDHRNYISQIASSENRSKASRFAKRNLVSAHQRDGKINKAIKLAEKILSTEPTAEEKKDVLFQLGAMNMFSLEDSSKAIEYFSQIVTEFPDDDIALVAADHIELLGGSGGLKKGSSEDSSDELVPKTSRSQTTIRTRSIRQRR